LKVEIVGDGWGGRAEGVGTDMVGGRLGLVLLVAMTARDCVKLLVSWEEDDIKANIRLREVIGKRKFAGKAKNRLVNEAFSRN
jgi:hypothetical protein